MVIVYAESKCYEYHEFSGVLSEGQFRLGTLGRDFDCGFDPLPIHNPIHDARKVSKCDETAPIHTDEMQAGQQYSTSNALPI